MSSSEYENDKRAKQAKAMVLKAKLDNVAPVGINNDEKLKPVTKKQKWENYWYHYKAHTFAGLALFIIVGVCVASFFAADDFDATLTIVSPYSFEGSSDVITANIDEVLGDYNGDKKINLNVQPVQIVVPGVDTSMVPDIMLANQAMLMEKISDKTSFLYMLDEKTYQALVELGCQFKTLDDFASSRINGDKYYLKDTNISKTWQLNGVVDEMFLCIFDFSKYEKPSAKSTREFSNQYRFLADIIEHN